MSTPIIQCHHPLSVSGTSVPSAVNGRVSPTASGQAASTISGTRSTGDPWSCTDEEGRKLRWKAGRKLYGGLAFRGDPLAEALEELWDGDNYLAVALQQGCDAEICDSVRSILDRACGLVRELAAMRETERLAGRFAALVSE